MYSVQCSVCIVQCTVVSVQCKVCCEQCAVDSVLWTVYSVQCVVDSVLWTVDSLKCAVDGRHCLLDCETMNIQSNIAQRERAIFDCISHVSSQHGQDTIKQSLCL